MTKRRQMCVSAELRAVDALDEEPSHIEGYAAVFDSPSLDLGGFREIVKPGAFTKTLKESDIRAYWQHDSSRPLGRLAAGTLDLSEDKHGLRVAITPGETSWGLDALASIGRGDVDQMSFGFRAVKDRYYTTDAGIEVRELIEVQLFEVSPVSSPAYPDTEIQVRSLICELTSPESVAPTTVIDVLRAQIAEPAESATPEGTGEGDQRPRLAHYQRRQRILEAGL